jgi:tRNA-dihydrouridine synthase B
MYSGAADWDAIGKIKNILKIPVIGNGDINTPEKALDCLNKSNCDGIAVGRGILGNPDLLYRIETFLDSGKMPEIMSIKERLDFARLHLEKEIEYRGEERAIRFMRKFIAWYLKGIKNVSKYRANFMKCDEISQIYALFDEIKNMI